MSERKVDDFLAKFGDAPVMSLQINSPGGDILSGLKLAQWVLDKGLDVAGASGPVAALLRPGACPHSAG
jgi:hypothetical protein